MRRILLGWALASLVSLALAWDSGIQPIAGPHDSLLYVDNANALLDGEPYEYDALTLMRLPGYPILLAANAQLGWRLHVTQQSLHLLSLLALMCALHGAGLPTRFNLPFGALACLHPALFYQSTVVYSEGLAVPALVTALAAMIALLGLPARRSLAVFSGWSIVLAAAGAVLWNTRPDALVLAPSALFVAGVALRGHARRDLLLRATLLLLPVLGAWLAGQAIEARHLERYGLAVRYDLEEENFADAFRTLTSLAPDAHTPRVPIPRAALEVAYEASPSFAELEPYLSWQRNGQGYLGAGCQRYDLCDDFIGGVAFIALRHAAGQAGKHASAAGASDFYGRVHAELSSACEAGVIACSSHRTATLYSHPLRPRDVPRIATTAVRLGRGWLSLDDLEPAFDHLAGRVPPEADVVERFERVTHDARRPWHFWAERFAGPYIRSFALLQWMLVPMIFYAAVGRWKRRRDPARRALSVLEPLPAAAACLALLLVSQLLLVAFLDAMGLPFRIRFFLAIHPATLAFAAVVAALTLGSRFREAPSDSPATR